MRIEACFDSHVHWAATGEFHQRLSLRELTQPEDVLKIKPQPHHYRGEWLLGFGWDENGWNSKPTKQILDQWNRQPVALSRCDAHALWVNSEGLKRAGISRDTSVPGGRIELDAEGEPTGLLIDAACDLVFRELPRVSGMEVRRNLLQGVQIFNEAGFTHIRDMTMDAQQWHEAMKLDSAGLLTLAVESYFFCQNESKIESTIALALSAQMMPTSRIRPKGLKIFLDGALGSEGAWLSTCYHGSDQKGLVLWETEALREVLTKCWEKNLEIAVHVIGDQAAEHIVELARDLNGKGVSGSLHLEHCELMRHETIQKMQGLKIKCHLQPSHWLSDKQWLNQKVGKLDQFAFPWRRLQEADVDFDFGSDSPIEPASVARTLQALTESAEAGIPRLLGSPSSFMGHHDLSWVPNSYSIFENGIAKQVVFSGEHLI